MCKFSFKSITYQFFSQNLMLQLIVWTHSNTSVWFGDIVGYLGESPIECTLNEILTLDIPILLISTIVSCNYLGFLIFMLIP